MMHTIIFLFISCIYSLFSPSLNAMDVMDQTGATKKPKPVLHKKHSRSKLERKTKIKTPKQLSSKRKDETLNENADSQSPAASPKKASPKKKSKKSTIPPSDVSPGTALKKSFSGNKDKEELKQTEDTPLSPSVALIDLERTQHDSQPSAASPTHLTRSGSSRDLETIHYDPHPPTASPKKASPQKKPKKSKIPSSDVSPETALKKSFSIKNDDNYLRKAIKNGNKKTIVEFLINTPDPNQQSIGPRNTLLHHAVYYFYRKPKRNLKLINLFVANPNVNSLIKNIFKRAPYQCLDVIQKEKYPALYKTLILRATLDHIIDALLITDPEIIATCFDENNILKDNAKLVRKLFIIIQRTSNILPRYATATFMRDMIQSRLKYNRLTIKELLRNYNKIPNYQDAEWGNTLIHKVVHLRDEGLLKKLLENPNVISIIKNSENLLPSQLVDSSEQSKLREMLFARASLDAYLERKAFALHQQKITHLEPTDENFQSIVTKTQEYFETIKIAQSEAADRELPDTALPQYINNATFLLQHCNFLLKKYKPENTTESDFKEHFIQINKKQNADYQIAIYDLRMESALQKLLELSESKSEESILAASEKASPTSRESKSFVSPGSLSDDMLLTYGLHSITKK